MDFELCKQEIRRINAPDGLGTVWEEGRASVQLLLCGRYRAVSRRGTVAEFRKVERALQFAQRKDLR